MLDILRQKLVKRGLDAKSLDPQDIKAYNKPKVQIKEGIEQSLLKLIKMIKDQKFKVQSSIQGEQVRVTGKKRMIYKRSSPFYVSKI